MFLFLIPFVSSIDFYADLNMKSKNIYNATNISATRFLGDGSSLTGVSTSSNFTPSNFTFCPSGSAQIGENTTARYCDTALVNTTDIEQFFNSSEAATFAGVTSNGIMYANSNLSFQNTSGTTIGYFYVVDASVYTRFQGALYFLSGLWSGGSITVDGDVNTKRLGDDIWVGNTSKDNAKAFMDSNGYIKLNTSNNYLALACTAARAGWIAYNHTSFKFLGCNSTNWVQLG